MKQIFAGSSVDTWLSLSVKFHYIVKKSYSWIHYSLMCVDVDSYMDILVSVSETIICQWEFYLFIRTIFFFLFVFGFYYMFSHIAHPSQLNCLSPYGVRSSIFFFTLGWASFLCSPDGRNGSVLFQECAVLTFPHRRESDHPFLTSGPVFPVQVELWSPCLAGLPSSIWDLQARNAI